MAFGAMLFLTANVSGPMRLQFDKTGVFPRPILAQRGQISLVNCKRQ
jgi:hypothetical protein